MLRKFVRAEPLTPFPVEMNITSGRAWRKFNKRTCVLGEIPRDLTTVTLLVIYLIVLRAPWLQVPRETAEQFSQKDKSILISSLFGRVVVGPDWIATVIHCAYWNKNVINFMEFSSLALLKFSRMTTFNAASDVNFIKNDNTSVSVIVSHQNVSSHSVIQL